MDTPLCGSFSSAHLCLVFGPHAEQIVEAEIERLSGTRPLSHF